MYPKQVFATTFLNKFEKSRKVCCLRLTPIHYHTSNMIARSLLIMQDNIEGVTNTGKAKSRIIWCKLSAVFYCLHTSCWLIEVKLSVMTELYRSTKLFSIYDNIAFYVRNIQGNQSYWFQFLFSQIVFAPLFDPK